jgi:hypothetical protein
LSLISHLRIFFFFKPGSHKLEMFPEFRIDSLEFCLVLHSSFPANIRRE